VGIFGVTIAKEFRGVGIGEVISKCTIEEGKKSIPGLKILTLNVFSPNTIAQNLYKKLGFIEYAKLPKGVWYKNEYIDEIKMYTAL
jgi:RimJ/RimL family protein N-acetyltransferase